MATRRYDFKFHCNKDADIIKRLDAQENKQQYIRSLIWSDIAADILRDGIQLEDVQAAYEEAKSHVDHDSLRFWDPCKHCKANDEDDPDPDLCDECEKGPANNLYNQTRIDFYNKNCPAISEPDPNVDACDGCKFKQYVDTDSPRCCIEARWNNYWYSLVKRKLNAAYGASVSEVQDGKVE